MKDNALRIILFVYIVSGCIAIGDILIAEPLGIQIQTMDGEPAGPQLSAIYQRMIEHDIEGRLAEAAGTLDAGTYIERAIAATELGIDMTVELFKMLAGLYVFDILTIFGVPAEITALITTVYVILVGRALLDYIKPITSAIRAIGSAIGSLRP